MRTIRIKAYKFDELSDQAKENAISNYRNSEHYDGFYYDEITDSVKAVVDLFSLQTGNRYTDFRTSSIDDCILELKGVRLYKYLINNYWTALFSGKWHNLPDTDKKLIHPLVKSEFTTYRNKFSNSYKSKMFFDHSCELTGVCYDEDILEPVYKFLERPCLNTTFEDLIKDMAHEAARCYDTTEDWLNSDEFISDMFENNDWEFTKDGKEI